MSILDQFMKKLGTQLAKQFPPYHYQHVKVFNAYWTLFDLIEECKPLKIK